MNMYGITIDEMCEALNLSFRAVATRIHRAGIKPITRQAIYALDTVDLIRDVKMGRPVIEKAKSAEMALENAVKTGNPQKMMDKLDLYIDAMVKVGRALIAVPHGEELDGFIAEMAEAKFVPPTVKSELKSDEELLLERDRLIKDMEKTMIMADNLRIQIDVTKARLAKNPPSIPQNPASKGRLKKSSAPEPAKPAAKPKKPRK